MMNFEEFKAIYQAEEVNEYFPIIRPIPLLTVLIQTFNHSDYISQCLDGVLNQETDFPFEIILGEDSSSDGTREICIRYASKNKERLRLLLHHPENKIRIQGITTGNFNAAYNFYAARGRYVAFCEGDDVWTDRLKLQKQINFLRKNPEFVMSYHSFREVNERGEPISEHELLDQYDRDLSESELQKVLFHPLISTVCFRRSFQELPEEILKVVNLDSFFLSFLGTYGKGKCQKNISPNLYRRHSAGIWTGRQKPLKLQSKIITFQNLCNFYTREGNETLSTFFLAQQKKVRKQLVNYYLRKGDFFKVVAFFKKNHQV